MVSCAEMCGSVAATVLILCINSISRSGADEPGNEASCNGVNSILLGIIHEPRT